ncbi:kinase domain-containing protein [Tothia fuscella]|uniref:Kinase domain-containing protein n=1 Tax=Tothia fuscella TaxID=1048955 RepID=A0A9P4U0K5_9PEZI|nr:kinase domain-containing protein [Tothia fuscella]
MTDTGDFIDLDNEEEVEDLENNAEDMVYYMQKPFYFPIRIGMLLNQKYRIVHKLGHGTFSTVWMARNTVTGESFAVKVPTITSHTAGKELAINNDIGRDVMDRSCLSLYVDSFTLVWRGYTLTFLVFPLRGPSLRSGFASMNKRVQMSMVKQLLQALEALHDAGFVHGDLNSKNVLCGIHPLEAYDTQGIYGKLGRPKKDLVQTEAGVAEIVRPAVFPPDLLNGSVYIADFGISIRSGTPVTCAVQSPAGFCAPERFHNSSPTAASDIWSYMCIFTELYFGTLLWSSDGDVLGEIVSILGPLPQNWLGHHYEGNAVPKIWYDPRIRPANIRTEEVFNNLIKYLRRDVTDEEVALVRTFMLKVFCYYPTQRLTATELLSDSSFRKFLRLYGV